ncbi:hypothetical protein BJ875DRAFT_486766 [Amylocarpus encephaloides]|uniref:Rhodopsin domain-containing protein n=1 Tax=Amylocarpus encephaloides TaxID=45428 RepID=A0A9P7YDK9_9HELO|nr:hypothetical protein BJ875DRAFT_486766 [Amylocarpus encephaloides]
MDSLPPSVIEALLDGPAMLPPKGVTANFDNPGSLNVFVVPTVVLAIVFPTLALLMRIYTQRSISRPLYWEDYIAILAWAMFIGFCVPSVICGRHAGAHQWDTPRREVFTMLYWSNTVQIVYCPAIFLVKLSILLQYMRIFVPSRQSNMGMFVGICVVFWGHFLFYVVDIFFQIFSCTPREKAWNKLITTGHCYDLPGIYVASGAVNVASDFIILLLPVFSIWKLKISTRQKMEVCGAFATGFLVGFLPVCAVSIARLVYIVLFFRTEDQTRAVIAPGLCGIAEISLGIICSCLPTVPMFLHVVRAQLPLISFFGWHPFAKTASAPFNSTASALRSKRQSHWDESGNKRLTKSYRELEDWQLSSKGIQLVHISSAGRRPEPTSDVEDGRIIQTTIVEIEECKEEPIDVRGKSYYDSS